MIQSDAQAAARTFRVGLVSGILLVLTTAVLLVVLVAAIGLPLDIQILTRFAPDSGERWIARLFAPLVVVVWLGLLVPPGAARGSPPE